MGLFSEFFDGELFSPERTHRIGDQLPYFQYEGDKNSPFYRVHLLKDGTLGICWKVMIPPSYSFDSGHETTIREFQSQMENLPQNYEMQIITLSHNNLTDRMKEYLSLDSGIDKARVLRESRAEKLIESGLIGYKVDKESWTMLRDTHMIVTLKSCLPSEDLGVLKTIIEAVFRVAMLIAKPLILVGVDIESSFSTFFERIVRQSMSEFKEAMLSVESTMNSMWGITADTRMTLSELKHHYWTAYCPSYREPGQQIHVDKLDDYNYNLFPLPVEHDYDIVKIGRDYHGVIMMAMMPDVVGPDYLSILRRTLPTQHMTFCCFSQVNQLMEGMKLNFDAQLRSRMAMIVGEEEANMFKQEASEVRTRMFQGRKIVYAIFGMVIHGLSKKEVEDRMLRVSSAFKKKSVVPDIERSFALQALTYTFPLAYTKKYTAPMSRTRRVLSDDLIDLLPIHGHWSGAKSPQSVYVNRDGEVVFFDHTDNDFINWHYAITGSSGSGKSFAVVDLVLQLFASGVERQFLMTIKDDYDRFAETMGRSIIIDLDLPTCCINPFTGPLTKQRLQQWTTSVELMLARGSDEEADSTLMRVIEQVVSYAYELVPEGDVFRPSWIREGFYKFPYESEEHRALGMQAADDMGAYCSDGVYGRLFDGFPSITEKDRLVVINLQNIVSEKISSVIINAIFTMLDNLMYMGDRGARKHLLVDEMVSLVSSRGGGQIASQIKRAFRTYRSLNCMCGIATQNEEDLTTDVGQAVIGNITKRIILKPRKEMIPMLMQSLGLRSERHEAFIASLDTKPGYYSEFYLMSPKGEVVCRLLTDKLTFALATTQPDDIAEITRIKNEKDLDYWSASVEFSKMYPQGVRAHRALIQARKEAEQREAKG